MIMKLISWNVNGLRACCDKGFRETFKTLDADFFCLQETKMQEGQLDLSFEGYTSYWNYAEKKATQVPLSLPATSRLPSLTVWESTSTTMRDVSLRWKWKTFIW